MQRNAELVAEADGGACVLFRVTGSAAPPLLS
jgi:hypothetical protein